MSHNQWQIKWISRLQRKWCFSAKRHGRAFCLKMLGSLWRLFWHKTHFQTDVRKIPLCIGSNLSLSEAQHSFNSSEATVAVKSGKLGNPIGSWFIFWDGTMFRVFFPLFGSSCSFEIPFRTGLDWFIFWGGRSRPPWAWWRRWSPFQPWVRRRWARATSAWRCRWRVPGRAPPGWSGTTMTTLGQVLDWLRQAQISNLSYHVRSLLPVTTVSRWIPRGYSKGSQLSNSL